MGRNERREGEREGYGGSVWEGGRKRERGKAFVGVYGSERKEILVRKVYGRSLEEGGMAMV